MPTPALAFESFGKFLERSFDAGEQIDRFIAGEEEYAWRLKNCLLEKRTPKELFEYGASESPVLLLRVAQPSPR